MRVGVLVFGIAREIVGNGSVTIQVNDVATVAQLKKELILQYPELAGLASFAIAVNGVYATDDMIIKQADEVAVIPPVSGG